MDEPLLTDHDVVDNHNNRVGTVTDVLFDERTTQPRWTTVKPGPLRAEHLAPMEGAYVSEEGVLVLSVDRDTVLHAPKPPRDHVLTPELADEAADYYALEDR
jgi:sporulation protein YlmC with PRC-barrel domain